MGKRSITILSVILILATTGASTFVVRYYPEDALQHSSLRVKGVNRNFYYYIPPHVTAHPRLLFAIPSGNMFARDMQLITGRQFNDLADKYKDMIIVYPEGYDMRWNDCRISNNSAAKSNKIDDVAFFEKMIDFFSENYNIDKGNTYAMGFHNGAQMCIKLAKEKPSLFKGFAAICNNMPEAANCDCYNTNEPVSILFMNGTADPIVPYNGGKVINRKGAEKGIVTSTDESIKYWVNVNKGDTDLKAQYVYPHSIAENATTVYQYYYPCNRTGKKVALVKIENGGHVFPNPVYNLWPKDMGNVTHDINAAEITVDFFRSL